MAKRGAFTFVLHSHLPYARNAGMWPHGEEWIHEAIADTYIPILDSLNELVDEGNHQSKELAKFYHHWYARHLTNFRDRYNRDILGAFKTLQDVFYHATAT